MRLALIVVLVVACGDDDSTLDADVRDDSGLDAGRDVGPARDALPDVSAPLDADLPMELEELPVNEWRAVSRNTISDVDPCPVDRCAWSAVEGLSGVVEDWTGGAYASNEGPLGGLLYFGGGHNGYYGNEVYFFNFATLLWERRGDPTDGQTPGDASTFGLDDECRFWDGAPLALHTYESVFYDPLQNRFWLTNVSDAPSGQPGPPDGCFSSLPAYFDLATSTWADSSPSPMQTVFSASAWDASRNVAWVVDTSASQVHRFDPVADTWQSYTEGEPLGIDVAAAIAPGAGFMVITDTRNADRLMGFDLANPDEVWFELTTDGDIEIQENARLGFEWSPELDAFVAYSEGRSLYLLSVPDDPRSGTWTWTRIDPDGVEPDMPVNGPYSKFQYIPEMGIAFVASSVTGPVFAIRLAR